MDLIPSQRFWVNNYFEEGKLINYSLSLDHGKLWAVFAVRSKSELYEMIEQLPLSMFMEFQISPLTYTDTVELDTPEFSLN